MHNYINKMYKNDVIDSFYINISGWEVIGMYKNNHKLKYIFKKIVSSYILVILIIGSLNIFSYTASAEGGNDVIQTYEYIGYLNQTIDFSNESQIFVNITVDNITGDPVGQYYCLKALNENTGEWVVVPVSDNDTNPPFENNTAGDGEYWGFFNVSHVNSTQNASGPGSDSILQVSNGDTINVSEDPNSELDGDIEIGYITLTILGDVGGGNNAPDSPTMEIPSNGSSNSLISTNISWNCTDPDGDPLTYNVYFANSTPPGQVLENTSNTSYNPGTLEYNTTYYWYIIAWDDNGAGTTGPSWWFTTENGSGGGPPQDGNGTGTIRGIVKDYLDDPLPGASVMLNRTDEQQMPQIVISNDTGVYIFDDNVTVGTYDIEAFKEGCESHTINNVTISENQTRWENITLGSGGGPGPGGDDSIYLDEWQSSVSPAYIMNNTEQNFTIHLILYGSPESRLTNVTVDLPTGYTCQENNWTNLGDTSNITVYNTDDLIVWEKNNQDGFFFSQDSYFSFNASSNAPLGSYQFNITIVYGDDNTSQTISKTVFTTTTFYSYGTIKDSNNQPIVGALANITVQSFGMDGCTSLGSFSGYTNSTGVYNITNIPTTEDVSTLNLSGPMGPGGGDGGLFYQLSAQENSGTYPTLAVNISATLPYVPITEYISMLQDPEIYLKPALTFRVNVTGPIYNWNDTSHQMEITYGPKNFSLMVKDQKLGYQVKEYNTMGGERTFSVPKNRNYSFSVFADQSFPISIRFNNIATTCAANGSLDQDGVQTSYMGYNGTYLINVSINVSSTNRPLTGFFNNVTDPLDMRVVAYTMEDQDMVFEDWALPFNLGNETGDGNEDVYNLSTGWYNITLPATVASSYLLLRAYVRNETGFYMGSANVSASLGNLSASVLNFSMQPMIQGQTRIISSNNVSDRWNSTDIVNTTSVLFRLVSNGELLSNENPFVEVKRELNGQDYNQMINGQSGLFNISLVEGESIKKLVIYSQQYAPISTPVSASVLNGSTNTSTITCSNGVCNITMRSFGNYDPLGKNASFMMQMLKSNETCNVPNPPEYCDLCADEGDDDNASGEIQKDDFSPFKAILKGDISLMIKSQTSEGWIYVYYANVDLLASGPPDAAFSTESEKTDGGLAAAWQFGSQGPEIYDYVLVGMPLNQTLVNKTVKVDIPLLYDNEFNVIWNATAGDTIDIIRNDSTLNTSYGDYLGTQYEAYLNGTGVLCDPNNPTLSNGIGYKDVSNCTIWIKIPHFSGVGPEVTGEEPDPPSSFTAIANSTSEIYLTWSLGTKADYTRIQRKTSSYPINISDGTNVYNGTGTAISDTLLTEDTTYYYKAWSWNQTNEYWSPDNSSSNVKTKAIPYKTGESPSSGSTNIDPLSTVYVVCRDNDTADTMTATWLSNSSGDWIEFGTNTNISNNNTNISQTNSNFSGYNTTYWWSVNLTDGTYWDNTTYQFTTRTQYRPDEPRSFTATVASSSSIGLSWTKGNYSDYTRIQRKTSSYPINISDGTNVYNGTGSSTTSSSLSSSTKYYYRAWAFNSTDGTWSVLNASANETTDSSSGGDSGGTTGGGSTGITIQDDASEEEDTTTSDANTSSSSTTLESISSKYNIDLELSFYVNDTNGDGTVDTFTDPNNQLTSIDTVSVNSVTTFLISTDDDDIPEFFWDPTTDDITFITHAPVAETQTTIDVENEEITITVSINKSQNQWIYLDTTDDYPEYELTVETSDGRTISSDNIWRKNGKIYVLDDPDTEYNFIYNYTILPPTFNPESGTTITTLKPTITVVYQEPVIIQASTFNGGTIVLSTKDNKTFAYTPAENLENKEYALSIVVEDNEGNMRQDTANYIINTQTSGKPTAKPPANEIPWVMVILVTVIVIWVIIGLLFKTGFLYMENKPPKNKK